MKRASRGDLVSTFGSTFGEGSVTSVTGSGVTVAGSVTGSTRYAISGCGSGARVGVRGGTGSGDVVMGFFGMACGMS